MGGQEQGKSIMNHLKTKILFIIVLFSVLPNTSSASFKIKEPLVQLCKKIFANKTSKNSHTDPENSDYFIINHHLNMAIPYIRNDPILLRHLEEFRADITPLLEGENPPPDLPHIQKKFNRLVLPWLFWRSTEVNTDSKSFLKMKFKDNNGNNLQEWGEESLGRSLNEQEVQALEEAYSYDIGWEDIKLDVQFFTKQKILEEAGFSEKEMDQLGRKATLRGRKTIALEAPQRTSIETELTAQGYDPDNIKGIDEIEELMAVGKQLLDLKWDRIDIYTAHIPYLAQKLREYIAYMETAAGNSTQRKSFEQLKEYVEILIAEKGVSYDKWLAVSLRLADILSEVSYPIHVMVRDLLWIFPNRIVMPTIAGVVGIMALNGTRSEKVESIALVKQDTLVDGNELTPISVVYHDKTHILHNAGTDKSFYDELKKLRGKLPVKIIQNAETAYHNLTHESSNKIKFNNDFLEITVKTLRFELISNFFRFQYIHNKQEEAFKTIAQEELKQKAQVIIDDFMYVFNKINQSKAQQANP